MTKLTGLSRPSGSRRGGRSGVHVQTLLAGFLGGAFVMYILMLPLGQVVDNTTDNTSPNTSNQLRRVEQQQPASILPGWHPIHVFFGDESGLNIKPGEQWFAQVHQDEIMIDLIGENGFFLDLAANDAKEYSNTLALEKHGWNGVCVEPNPGYWYGLSHRKCTVVGALVSDKIEKVNVKFRGVFGGIVGKMDEKLANRKREPKAPTETRFTSPLKDVLSQFDVPKTIDYMSLDVEGAEYDIMQHFPFDQYTIRVLTAERPNKQLRALLEEHGYIHLKDLAWWGETLWAHKSTGFTPQHAKIAKIKTEERN